MNVIDKYKPRIEKLARKTKENDATASKSRIIQAFETAAELHKGVMRNDKVTPYIDHPVSVAEIVADNGGDQRMVVAALLHDTVEDTQYTLQTVAITFGQEIADIVDALTQVEESIPDDITDNHQRRLVKNYIDGLSNAKLLDSENPQSGKAIYIKLADRLHNMRTIDCCSKDARVRKASDTLKFFVPLAKVIGSSYFEHELSELCFKVLQPELYGEIEFAYEDTRAKNSRFISSFMKTLDNALRNIPADKNCAFQKLGTEPFKCYQINQLLSQPGKPYGSLGGFSKSSVYLYEIVLEYQAADDSKMLEDFIDVYLTSLRPFDISMELLFEPFDNSDVSLCLRDAFSNKYLVHLVWQGHVKSTSDYGMLFPPENSITEMPNAFITVFSKDREPYQMMEGSTVLDFAFRIHPDLGCSARFGVIRRSNQTYQTIETKEGEAIVLEADDVECEIDHPLQDGDCVYVIGSRNEQGMPMYLAEYEWFNYAKTKYARDHLIEFFNKTNPNSKEFKGVVSWNPVASKKYA